MTSRWKIFEAFVVFVEGLDENAQGEQHFRRFFVVFGLDMIKSIALVHNECKEVAQAVKISRRDKVCHCATIELVLTFKVAWWLCCGK